MEFEENLTINIEVTAHFSDRVTKITTPFQVTFEASETFDLVTENLAPYFLKPLGGLYKRHKSAQDGSTQPVELGEVFDQEGNLI